LQSTRVVFASEVFSNWGFLFFDGTCAYPTQKCSGYKMHLLDFSFPVKNFFLQAFLRENFWKNAKKSVSVV